MKPSIPTFFAIALTATHPHAQTLPGDLLNCKNVQDDAARLSCFDTAVAKDRSVKVTPPAATAEKAAEPEVPKSKWRAEKQTSAMTDDTNHYVTAESNDILACRPYGTATGPITIMVRCLEDTTALILYGDCQFASGFDGYGEVTWRTDGDKPVTRSFDASTDSQALGIWTGKRAIPAIQSLFGKEKLVVRVTPFGMSPIEATFNISGLEEAVKPLREECGW